VRQRSSPVVRRAPSGVACRRVGRRLMVPLLGVASVILLRAVAGPVAAAIVGGVALPICAVAWWVRVVEPRLFAPRGGRPVAQLVRPVTVSSPSSSSVPPRDRERHVAFAQALAYVATRYLAECQDEVDRERDIRP
jgi:hypothetical protein